MHIALIHYFVPPVVGGVESVLAQDARLMTRADHSVRLLAARGEPISEQIQFVCLPLLDSLHPRGMGVVVEGAHLCSMMRGVRKANARMVTSAVPGGFKTDARTCSEFFEHIRKT